MAVRGKFEEELLRIEQAANQLRQRLDDSQAVAASRSNGKIGFEEVPADEWEFDRRAARRLEWTSVVIDAMSAMQPGDRVRVGPFDGNRSANRIRSRISNIVSKILKWEPTADGFSPYEFHVKDGYIYIMRKQ